MSLLGVLHDEVHDGFGVFEAVGVMADSFLADDFDGAAEFLVAFFNEVGVFSDGDNFIDLADDVEEGNAGLGERLKVVNRVVSVGFGLFFGDLVSLENLRLDAGPAFEITNGGVGVNAGNLVGILGGPVEDDETAARHSLEGGLL